MILIFVERPFWSMIKIRGEAEGQEAGDVHLLTKKEVVVHEAVRQQNEDRIELHPHRSDASARRVCRPVQRSFEDMELEMRFVERVMEKSKLNFP